MDVTIGQQTIALGAVYFPVDNTSSAYGDAEQLSNELLQNMGVLQNKFSRMLLVGDFNGKVKQFRQTGKPSTNGVLIEELINATNTVLLNTSEKCSGTTTWRRGEQTSTIDYAICSSDLYSDITSMLVDEDQKFSVGSDHNFLIIETKVTLEQQQDSPLNKKSALNITINTDWKHFESAVNECFSDWDKSNGTKHQSISDQSCKITNCMPQVVQQ